MNVDFFTACERLLSATVNGVYQGIFITALAGLFLHFLVRTNAATRHAVWFGVLVVVTALIPVHLILSLLPHSEAAPEALHPAPFTSTSDYALSDTANAVLADATPDESPASRSDGVPIPSSAVSSSEVEPGGMNSSERPDDVTPSTSRWQKLAGIIVRPLTWIPETAINLPRWMSLGLISIWALLAGIRGWLIVRRIVEVRQCKRISSPPSDGLQSLFDKLHESIATRRNVRLRLSSTPRTAVLLGFVHPVVLLPADHDTDAIGDEVEHVLRHELAHVDRRDDWGNLAQQVVQSALFFHPAIWWISARLSLEREIACDDRVLEASGRPRDYALTLANVARRMIPCRHALAPGVSNNHSQLQHRITMILNTQRDRSSRLAISRLGFFTSATAILAVLAIAAGPRLVLAQTPPPPVPPSVNAAPGTPAPDALPESGPRFKIAVSENSADLAPRPRLALVAATPATPEVPDQPATPSVVLVAPAAPTASIAPVPPVPPVARAGRRHNASIEERLDRIERALEELEARNGASAHHHAVDGKPMAEYKFDYDAKRGEADAKRAAEMAQRVVEAGQRAAEAGQRQAEAGQRLVEAHQRAIERAAEAGERDAERAMRDLAKLKDKNFERLSELESEAPMKALEALRSAHESLGRQIQAIEKQIKRLEEEQNQPKRPGKRRSEAPEDGPKTDTKPEAKTL